MSKNPNVNPEEVLSPANIPPPQEVSFNRRDLILYALGIGAKDLQFTYENDANFSMFPTFPVVLPFRGTSSDIVPFGSSMGGIPGLIFDPGMILHGGESIEILQHPLPTEGSFTNKRKVIGLWDKGSGAVVETETITVDEKGVPLVRKISSTFIRGLGNFGGEKGPSANVNLPPKRSPDAVDEQPTLLWQALLYRLSGDYNPLHASPDFAKQFGFPAPILHGLCTMGFAANSVLKTLGGNNPTAFKRMDVRFSNPVIPGDTLETRMWKEGKQVVFEVWAKERQKKVISNAVVEFN